MSEKQKTLVLVAILFVSLALAWYINSSYAHVLVNS
jgi:hypothetical protein